MRIHAIQPYVVLSREYESVAEAISLRSAAFSEVCPPVLVSNFLINIWLRIGETTVQLTKKSAGDSNLDMEISAEKISWNSLDHVVLAVDDAARVKGLELLLSEYYLTILGEKLEIDLAVLPSILSSFDSYAASLGFREQIIRVPEVEAAILQNSNPMHLIHNPSCTGKTFLGLDVGHRKQNRIAFRPVLHDHRIADTIICLLGALTNSGVLFDDVQSDPAFARQLLRRLTRLKPFLFDLNNVVIVICWADFYSLLLNETPELISQFFDYSPNVGKLRASLRLRGVDAEKYVGYDDKNIAVLDALWLTKRANSADSNREFLDALIKGDIASLNENQLNALYVIATLGSYEFAPTLDVLSGISDYQFRKIDDLGLPYRQFEKGRIFLGHRAICEVVSELLKTQTLPSPRLTPASIVSTYIGTLKTDERWRAVSQIISTDRTSMTGSFLHIWRLVSTFEKELEEQTLKDPLWRRAPSSLYFVARAAIELGVVDKHTSVIMNFVDIFELKDEKLVLRTDDLLTIEDFKIIKEKMKTVDDIGDVSGHPLDDEQGSEIDLNLFHENWLLGFGLGLEAGFTLADKLDVYQAIVAEVKDRQLPCGLWYPKRVPWVTSRVLIGCGQAGLQCRSEEWVERACRELIKRKGPDGYWAANTGGWNNPYETTALVLEALSITHSQEVLTSEVMDEIARNLLSDLEKWAVLEKAKDEQNQITMVDGVTAACVLLKNGHADENVLAYLLKTEEHFAGKFFIGSDELDLNNNQSCALAQVPYFLIEAGWGLLASDIGELLEEYLERANTFRVVPDEKLQVFVSYCTHDEGDKTFALKLAERLTDSGILVFFDRDQKGGMDNDDFMRKVKSSDKVIIIGSAAYRNRSDRAGTGVHFEVTYMRERQRSGDNTFVIPIVRNDSFQKGLPDGFMSKNGIEYAADLDDDLYSRILKLCSE